VGQLSLKILCLLYYLISFILVAAAVPLIHVIMCMHHRTKIKYDNHSFNHSCPRISLGLSLVPIWNAVEFQQFLWNYHGNHAWLACAYYTEDLQPLDFIWHNSLYMELHVWPSMLFTLRYIWNLSSSAERKQSKSFWNSNRS
jgi:hypothetical protein